MMISKVRVLWLLLILYFLSFTLAKGNEIPEFLNLKLEVDSVRRQLNLTYDLIDRDDEDIKITVRVSEDGGKTFLAPFEEITGDVGFPVKVGKEKRVVIRFSDSQKSFGRLSVKIIADDMYKIDIRELVKQVDTVNLKKLVHSISGERNYRKKKNLNHLESVRDIITKEFENSNLDFYRQDFSFPDRLKNVDGENLIGTAKGQYEEEKFYILSAHYDCAKDSPGADDNATGVAGMLEALRILSKFNFKHSIKFIGFDLEEVGCLGSIAYIDSVIKKKESIEGVINFDMIGFYSDKENSQLIPTGFDALFADVYQELQNEKFKGNFVLNTANDFSSDLGKKYTYCVEKYVPSLSEKSLVVQNNGRLTPNLRASDHYEFWINGFKAIHIGDAGESRNVNLNGPKDVTGPLNYRFMADIVKATIASLSELAQIQHLGVYQISVK